jgi:immune inhibitor A
VKFTVPGNGMVDFRFRYQTDGGVHLAGAFIDDIVIKSGSKTVLTDPVETENGWTAEGGFALSTGTEESVGDRYYLLENRTYAGYDSTLAQGPYIFSRQVTAPDWVDRFPYQDGLLVWAVDETYTDNNTSEHVGHALTMPVDARPAPVAWSDGTKPAPRRLAFDATFGLQPTDATTFRKEIIAGKGQSQSVQTLEATVPSSPGIPTFTDSDPDAYWSADYPLSSIKVAGWGVIATVTSQTTGGPLTINVTDPA